MMEDYWAKKVKQILDKNYPEYSEGLFNGIVADEIIKMLRGIEIAPLMDAMVKNRVEQKLQEYKLIELKNPKNP